MIEVGKLPNLRRLTVPDVGHSIIDMDLSRADLFVVAADSGCTKLMQRLLTMDVHTYHADQFMVGSKLSAYDKRQYMKKLVHAGNYLVGTRTASMQTGLPEATIRAFLIWYYGEYPEIGSVDKSNPDPNSWHSRIAREIREKGYIKNAFGYRKPLFDRPENVLPEFVAWTPQSTVGLVINKALDNITHNCPSWIEPLMQVHDSLVLQAPTERLSEAIPLIRQNSLIPIPYNPPLIIPVGFKTSPVSWGDVKEYKGVQT